MGKYDTSMKAARGQKVVTEYGRDNSSHNLPDTKGGSMGGSTTNVAHSLPGASAKEGGNASKDKTDKFS